MKHLLLLITLFLVCNIIYSQNGTYRCNFQKFTDENDSSRNKEHSNSMLVTIEINEYTGGSVLVTWLPDNTIYKWVLTRKIDDFTTPDGVKFSNYGARFSLENVLANKESIVSLINDPSENTLHLAVNNPEAGTTNWYYYLTKVTY